MDGQNPVRSAQDIGGQDLSYAEVKAIASGNPAVLTLAEADAELQRLTVLKKNHADEQFLARRNLRDLPGAIARRANAPPTPPADMETASAHAHDPLTVGDRTAFGKDGMDLLGRTLNALPDRAAVLCRFPLGVFQGLRFGLMLHPQFAPDLYLEGAVTR